MTNIFSVDSSTKKTFLIPVIVFLLIIIVNFILILILNSFHFTYTIDDAYIHLALAEQIGHFHYGINIEEFSSPSSSIIWPFLLTPFSILGIDYFIPLIINIISSIGILYIFWNVLLLVYRKGTIEDDKRKKIITLLLTLIIITTNLVYSSFRGMEHTLQSLVSVIIAWGLIDYIQNKKISKLLIASILIAPLVRYENLALSFTSLMFIFMVGGKKISALLITVIIIEISGFSFFLVNLGLDPVPFSISQKSSIISSERSLSAIGSNLWQNITSLSGILFVIFSILLFIKMLKNNKKETLFAATIIFSIVAQLIFGQGRTRYTEYLHTTAMITVLFLYRDFLVNIMINGSFLIRGSLFTILALILSYKSLISIFLTPLASNNIYEQQYQMHRFVVEYYKKPVAVNDIGCVSYKNNSYVLDYVGLSTKETSKFWKTKDKSNWMDKIARNHNVKLAIIYENWFTNIPSNWSKVAKLYLGKLHLTPSENMVSFYIIDLDSYNEVYHLLHEFSKTLPEGTTFIIL